jgi:glycosyltransferase involved in cell wall biosynthesis
VDKTVKPRVSVILPVFNSEAFIKESIDSVLRQTFSNFELIVIDDASTDRTVDVVKTYADPRLVLVEKKTNTGYTFSLNHGLAISAGEYIARMDADDIMADNRIKEQVEFMDTHSELAASGTWYKLTKENRIVSEPSLPEEVKVTLLDYCCLAHPTSMIRRQLLLTAGLKYDPVREPAEDYDLWTRLVAFGNLANLPRVLLNYRQHDRQVSRLYAEKQHQQAEHSRKRMLNYLIPEASGEELGRHLQFLDGGSINDVPHFNSLIAWGDKLRKANLQTGFFNNQLLSRFIRQKELMLARHFLNTQPVYNFTTLSRFIAIIKYAIPALTAAGLFKLWIKSLLHIKNR